MLNPKEKSKEILDYYAKIISPHVYVVHGLSQACALKAVNEIIDAIYLNQDNPVDGAFAYWSEVKKEIELL